MEGFLAILNSKKAIVVLTGILSVLILLLIGFDPTSTEQIVNLVMTYLASQGSVDAVRAFRNKK